MAIRIPITIVVVSTGFEIQLFFVCQNQSRKIRKKEKILVATNCP